MSLPPAVLVSQARLVPSPREERAGRGLGRGAAPHPRRAIAWLLRTKQARYISRLESSSSPRPSPPLFVEEREANHRAGIVRARTRSRYPPRRCAAQILLDGLVLNG